MTDVILTAEQIAAIRDRAQGAIDGEYGPLAMGHDSSYGPRLTGEVAHDIVELCDMIDAITASYESLVTRTAEHNNQAQVRMSELELRVLKAEGKTTMTDDFTARAAAERLARLNTPGAAMQAPDGYPDADLRDPVIADAEANPQIGLPLGDAPRRGKTNAIREGR